MLYLLLAVLGLILMLVSIMAMDRPWDDVMWWSGIGLIATMFIVSLIRDVPIDAVNGITFAEACEARFLN